MVKVLLGGIVIGALLLVVGIARSHGDAVVPPPLPAATPEQITGSPVTPAHSSEPPIHEPFTPYPIGQAPTEGTPKPYWTYDDLPPDTKAVIDLGRDVTGREEIHNAYAAAAADLAQRAAGEAAQHQLGVDNLATTGVIP